MTKLLQFTKVLPETNEDPEYEGQEQTCPVAIDPEQIREFYPRRYDRPGTRLVFRNGAGCPVTETYEQVVATFNGLHN